MACESSSTWFPTITLSIYLSRCLRSKLHESSTYRVNGVRITFGWNPAYEDAAKLAAKQAAAEPLTDAEASWWRRRPASGPTRPDVWVWSPGKWFGVAAAPDKRQFELMARRVRAQAARYTEKGGTRFIVRTITPYAGHPNSSISRAFSLDDASAPAWASQHGPNHVPSALRATYSLDAYHEWIYRQTRERFSEFCELDAWNMMASRADLVSSSSSSSGRRRRRRSSSSSRPTRLARTLTLTLLPTPTPTLTEA